MGPAVVYTFIEGGGGLGQNMMLPLGSTVKGVFSASCSACRKAQVTLRMIATDKDQEFTMPDGRQYVGTGGNWAREQWR